MRSSVHRRIHMDYLGVKTYGPTGEVVGERRFVGLFTSAAYNRTPRDIPYLRRKVARTLERAGFEPASHDGKELINVLESLFFAMNCSGSASKVRRWQRPAS